jgi:hypothetical protein
MYARKTFPAVLVAAVLAGVAPLTSRASMPAHESRNDRAPDLQQVQRDWSKASRTLMQYGVAQRNEALARGRKLLDRMDGQLDALEAQTQRNWSKLSRAAREHRREALRELRRQRNRVAEWYGGMEHGSAGAWDQVKRGFVTAYGALDSAFVKAAKEFKRG